MDGLRSTHLMTLKLDVGFAGMIDIGMLPHGRRRMAPVTGGTFEGERLRGSVLPGGVDWVLNRPDGTMLIDVRLPLKTDDGAHIYLQYTGAFRAAPDVMKRFNRGEAVADGEYTLRITPRFECGAERYAWLNDLNALGTGQRTASGNPIYTMYEVL